MKCLLNSTGSINTTENQQALFFYFMGEKTLIVLMLALIDYFHFIFTVLHSKGAFN